MLSTHIIPAVSSEASGPSYSVIRLCESLIEQGQDVALVALDWAPIEVPRAFLKLFPLGFGPRRLGRSPAMSDWLNYQANSGGFDIIHNHSLWMMPNVYPGRTASRYAVPYVVSPRGTLSVWAKQSGSSMKNLFWPFIQRPSLSSVTCFHATAYSEYEDIRRIGFRQPVAVIPNGIDVPPLQKNLGEGAHTLLFLGRIHPVKGLDMLLAAWSVLQSRFPDWRLCIAGPDNGGYLHLMRSLASKLNLQRVEFTGPLYGTEKWRTYAEADLFVLPTYSENFGMSVAEALASGTPVITTRGAPWHGLETHDAGWWIDIGLDPLVVSLENAMGQSRGDLLAMGQRGREWMKSDYSWQHVGWQMSQTYRWILGGCDRPEWVIED